MAKKEKSKGDRLAGPIAMPGPCRSATTASSATARSRRCRTRRLGRLDVPAALRLAERLRQILGRRAGSFRVAPVDITVPADRRYLPGTMILETSWAHRHRLDHRARRAADRPVAPRGRPLHHLPPHAQRLRGRAHPAAHHPLRVGRGADDHGLRAGARLRPRARPLGVHRHELPPGGRRAPSAPDVDADPHHRHAAGLRGRPGQRPDPAQGGRRPLRRAVLGRRRAAHGLRRRLQAPGLDRPPLAALAGPRPVPRPPVAQLPAAQRAHAEGPDLRADRRARRRGQRPRCPETLGGDRNYDYRFTWIRDATFAPVGHVLPRLRLGGRRLLRLHRRDRRADDDLQIMYGIGGERELVEQRARPPSRATPIPGRCGSATPRTPSSSTTSGAPCSTRCTCTPRRPTTSTTGSGRSSRSRWPRRSSTGASPTPASGRSAAS